MRNMLIRTQDLTRHYGQQRGIEDVTFEVEPGEIFALLGQRGAGKTTLIHLLLDITHPSEGRAMVLSMDSRTRSLEIRRLTGYLPAVLRFDGRRTAAEILTFLAGLRGQVDWARVQTLAGKLELDLSARAAALGESGERKIGLVQAFMHAPDLVLLDEPTRGLDAGAQAAFYRLASEERAAGRSILFSTERMGEAERICDRVAILREGRLLAVERGVQMRARALRVIEMRFATPPPAEVFARLPNLGGLRVDDNVLRCTWQGDTDGLIKIASQYRVTDFISQPPSLDEAFRAYYG